MTIIDKYLTKLFFKYVTYSSLVSFVILFVLAYIDASEIVVTSSFNLIAVSFYRTVANIVIMMQFIVLIATILLIFNLQKQRMVIVLKSSGMGNVKLFRSLLVNNLILSLLFILLIHPVANFAYNKYFLKIRSLKSINVDGDIKMNLIMQDSANKQKYYIVDAYYKHITDPNIQSVNLRNISVIKYDENIPISIFYSNNGSLNIDGSLDLDSIIEVKFINNTLHKSHNMHFQSNYNVKKLLREIVANKKSNMQFKNIYDAMEKFLSLSRKGKESIIIWHLKLIEIIRYLVIFMNMTLLSIVLLVNHHRTSDNFRRIAILMIIVILFYSFDMFIIKATYTNVKNSLINLVIMPHLLLLNLLAIKFVRR